MERADWLLLGETILVALSTTLHFLFGGWSVPLGVLIALMGVDLFSGTLSAHERVEYNSSIGKAGVKGKVGVLAVIVVANMIDMLLMLSTPVVRTATIYAFAVHEIGSIFENFGKLGWWIPKSVKQGLAQLLDKAGGDNE